VLDINPSKFGSKGMVNGFLLQATDELGCPPQAASPSRSDPDDVKLAGSQGTDSRGEL
jgi:hypothetical protein